jgi:hypothetical protein
VVAIAGANALESIACASVSECVTVDSVGNGFTGIAAVTGSPPTSTRPPTIAGPARQRRTLTARSGSWSNGPILYSYQWQDCDKQGNRCAPIFGAAKQTYALHPADVGHTIRVAVTATNSGGPSFPIPSPHTSPVRRRRHGHHPRRPGQTAVAHLNAIGRRLLTHRHTLPIELTISSARRRLLRRTITLSS